MASVVNSQVRIGRNIAGQSACRGCVVESAKQWCSGCRGCRDVGDVVVTMGALALCVGGRGRSVMGGRWLLAFCSGRCSLFRQSCVCEVLCVLGLGRKGCALSVWEWRGRLVLVVYD